MSVIDELSDEERAQLEKLMPKALKVIDMQDTLLRVALNELAFCEGKLERIDAEASQWAGEASKDDRDAEIDEDEEDLYPDVEEPEIREMRRDCGSAILGFLGGYRKRLARLRAEGLLPAKDAETSEGIDEMMASATAELRKNRAPG